MSALPDFLRDTEWKGATQEPLTGDASARRYFRLRTEKATAILMDASRVSGTVAPFIQIAEHLGRLGLSAPNILRRDVNNGFLLLEDFGDETFSRLLDKGFSAEELFTLGTDVLISLHKQPNAVPHGLRSYSPQAMLGDAELYLSVHGISGKGEGEFRNAWNEILPVAHEVPTSLLLRDYHVANLMLLGGARRSSPRGFVGFSGRLPGAGDLRFGFTARRRAARFAGRSQGKKWWRVISMNFPAWTGRNSRRPWPSCRRCGTRGCWRCLRN